MLECLSPRTFRVAGEQCRRLESLSLERHCDFGGALADAGVTMFPALRALRVNGVGRWEEFEKSVLAGSGKKFARVAEWPLPSEGRVARF
jgi:hypothetical protein